MKATRSFIKHICLVLTVLLFTLHKSDAQNTDINLLRNINVTRNKALDGTMKIVTNSVYPISLVIPATELVHGYERHDSNMIRQGWQTVAGLGINTILTSGLKYTVNRKRPFITYPAITPVGHDTDPSFPSGHTSYAFYTATSLSICFPKWYVIAPFYTWATTVGYSRMHLGMHYPSDVLAGAIIGSSSAWLAYKGNQWLQHRKHKTVVKE